MSTQAVAITFVIFFIACAIFRAGFIIGYDTAIDDMKKVRSRR